MGVVTSSVEYRVVCADGEERGYHAAYSLAEAERLRRRWDNGLTNAVHRCGPHRVVPVRSEHTKEKR